MVCHLVAPKAKAPSLYDLGTAVSASSAMLTIVGIAMNASIIEPEKAVRPVGRLKNCFTKGTSVTTPIKPRTTLGIAARSSTPALRYSFILGDDTSAI